MAREKKSSPTAVALELTGEIVAIDMLTGASGDGFAVTKKGRFECDKAIAEILLERGYARSVAAETPEA